jgi:hypothetical protein
MPRPSRVHILCRVRPCRRDPFDLGMCKKHWLLFKRGRIDQHGKRLPLTCRKCNRKFFYARSNRRELCDTCKRTTTKPRATREQIIKKAAQRNKIVLKLRKQGLAMREIGRLLGISGERVRQILQGKRVLE